MKKLLLFFLFIFIGVKCIKSQETIFADYFDIRTNSPEGTPVIGGIHIERNKDVIFNKIPTSYHFEIIKQENDLFGIKTTFDKKGRIKGSLFVKEKKNTGKKEKSYILSVALKDNNKVINEFDITINILNNTL